MSMRRALSLGLGAAVRPGRGSVRRGRGESIPLLPLLLPLRLRRACCCLLLAGGGGRCGAHVLGPGRPRTSFPRASAFVGEGRSRGRRRWGGETRTPRWRGIGATATATGEEADEGPAIGSAADGTRARWEFAAAYDDGDDERRSIRTLLVCGDGDLSHSAEISSELERGGIRMIATVLEEEDVHGRGESRVVCHFAGDFAPGSSLLRCQRESIVFTSTARNAKKVYRRSERNAEAIAAAGHEVAFGVDATDLSTCLGDASSSFDRIQFNFPHWRGKANHRYNRQLLGDFLRSASEFLAPRGEVHVALCGGQGGCSATSLQEWRGSWTASMLAAERAGLLLARSFPYDPPYNLSSHRGVDRPFNLGNDPTMHVFVRPDGVATAPREVQLCCRHELHVVLPEDDDGGIASLTTDWDWDDVVRGDAIETLIRDRCVPVGIRVEVPARQILDVEEPDGSSRRIAVFLVVYCGERHHVARDAADEWREKVEQEVAKRVPLRENRRGRTVSRPFPYPALHPEIKYMEGKRKL
ncbi:hypothetical protein ACHAWF_002543 [Thalassiosira exigua]